MNPASPTDWADPGEPTLVDVLDRLLSRGIVIRGEIWITVADVDLLFIGAQVLIASPEAMAEGRLGAPRGVTA